MTENKIIKILMVDDHPSMLEGYKTILSYNPQGYVLSTTSVHSCKEAFEIITDKLKTNYFDVAFLDYSLPIYEEENINNGEDLAILLKKYSPHTKTAILTSHTESILLYDLILKIDPAGVLVKSDFNAEQLIYAFDTIVRGEKYYSKIVKQILDDVKYKNTLDKINMQILKHINNGMKTKNLPALLDLSQSAIEKRKLTIKTFLEVPGGTDEDIIKSARKKGFI